MTKPFSDIPRQQISFTGFEGNKIAADQWSGKGSYPILLAPGGGQTRHAWGGCARRLAGLGFHVTSIDQRGHGDSEWPQSGDYSYSAFARDLVCVANKLKADTGQAPVAIGASLGGIAALCAQGREPQALSGLVLVDITPSVEIAGVEKVLSFMAANVEEGFASLEEAANTIAEYLPHRKRPKNLEGLAKNLRRGEDGAYRWHWDPRFLDNRQSGKHHRDILQAEMITAAKSLTISTLLVRGKSSELVSEENAREFMELVPHADFADVSDASHMVAGDKNDRFTEAVEAFVEQNFSKEKI
jgi:pimeloyl-ACP methyl ester carboxylesterase